MKDLKFYVLVFVTVLFSSCSDDKDDVIKNPTPENLEVKVTGISSDLATIEMSATISDNTQLTYDVYLNNVIVKEGYTSNTLVLAELESATDYYVKVVVKSAQGKAALKTIEFKTLDPIIPSTFEVEVNEIEQEKALIIWTESKLSNGENVVYDVYVDDNKVVKSLTDRSYKLENLKPFTLYKVEVVARYKRETSTKHIDFRTLGTPPSEFPLSLREGLNGKFDPYDLWVEWTPPTVEDGSWYNYQVYLNDELLDDGLFRNKDSYHFFNLKEDTEYTFRLVAKSSNNTEREESITFTTRSFLIPSDFEISVTDIRASRAKIAWSESKADNYEVTYTMYINDDFHKSNEKFDDIRRETLWNLQPGNTYTIKIIARAKTAEGASGGYIKYKVEEVTFTTNADYPIHPSISVDEAVLYTKDSQFFPGQLIVKGIPSLKISYKEFFVADFSISNSLIQDKVLTSNVLTDEEYEKVKNNPVGYVLISEFDTNVDYYDRIIYKLPFNVVIKKN
ncbi:fibronectin type III domain-containing protein [Tenacibaculum agarivorans]|uniref:fibronectin type III domain-containing protein n=1 Tax=Tenacibaculum agarivorans TaxID=1908389 RepID=UPI00094B92AD|nr:fibronectin type III domain-containing protein [Tenacibaculum agarivorans]